MSVTYVHHPFNKHIFDISQFADIRCCDKNPTHVDFYKEVQAEGKRGTPDFIIEFKDEKQRNDWFDCIGGELGTLYMPDDEEY